MKYRSAVSAANLSRRAALTLSSLASLCSTRLALSLPRRYLPRKFSWKFRSGGPKFPGPKHTQAKGLRKDNFQDQSSGDIPNGLRKDISLQSLNSI